MTDNYNVASELDTPRGVAVSYNSQQYDEDDTDYTDYAKLYDLGISILRSKGFHLERSAAGSHCGHNVYVSSLPKPLAGISYPPWFRHLQLIQTEADEARLLSVLQYSTQATAEVEQFWSPLTQPLSGQRATPLQGYVERLARIDLNARSQNENRPHKLGIQLDCFTEAAAAAQAPRAYLPPREWFAPQLHQLTFADVFTLWPAAELDMLQLLLGRAFVGRSGNQHVGSGTIVEHTFRSVGIVVGEDPGLGKSTVFEKLFRAINCTGYRRSNFRDISERFGMAEVLESDIAYKDDVTGKTLNNLISSENTKIIASGGQMLAEDKFAKSQSIASRTVVLANTNEWNPRLVYGLDSGIVDRIKLLATYRRSELGTLAMAALSPICQDAESCMPFQYLPWLARKLNVDEEAVLLWAARLAADKFRLLCFERGEVPDERLRDVVHDVSTRLRLSFNKDVTRSLISGMLLAYLLLEHLNGKYANRVRYEHRELSHSLLGDALSKYRMLVADEHLYRVRGLIKYHWELFGRPATHPWTGIRKLNFTSLRAACASYNNATSTNQTLAVTVQESFSKLTLRDGFTGSSDLLWVTSAWQSVSGYVSDLEALARCIDGIVSSNSAGEDDMFYDTADFLARCRGATVSDAWLDSPDYTPSKVQHQLRRHDRGFSVDQYTELLRAAEWRS